MKKVFTKGDSFLLGSTLLLFHSITLTSHSPPTARFKLRASKPLRDTKPEETLDNLQHSMLLIPKAEDIGLYSPLISVLLPATVIAKKENVKSKKT
jgi:hypothetical protein